MGGEINREKLISLEIHRQALYRKMRKRRNEETKR